MRRRWGRWREGKRREEGFDWVSGALGGVCDWNALLA